MKNLTLFLFIFLCFFIFLSCITQEHYGVCEQSAHQTPALQFEIFLFLVRAACELRSITYKSTSGRATFSPSYTHRSNHAPKLSQTILHIPIQCSSDQGPDCRIHGHLFLVVCKTDSLFPSCHGRSWQNSLGRMWVLSSAFFASTVWGRFGSTESPAVWTS